MGGGLPTGGQGSKFMCCVRNPRNINVFVRVPGLEESGSRAGGSVTGVTEKLFMCQMFMCLFRPYLGCQCALFRQIACRGSLAEQVSETLRGRGLITDTHWKPQSRTFHHKRDSIPKQLWSSWSEVFLFQNVHTMCHKNITLSQKSTGISFKIA